MRVQKMQKENYERTLELDALREEGQQLTEENIKLKNDNSDLEKHVEQKKEILKNNFK